jgi:exopolyphosphatase/guanosine-5'-triphosphate,3'-diphosphate pyrophosphatase
MQKRIGIIDLGSNTTRMIVMGYTPHHSFRLLDEVRENVRLAEGIGPDGRLKPAAMDRAVATMRLFHTLSHSEHVQTIVPVATSAVREATNQAEFIARVAAEAGLPVRVLSAREEAYYGYLGVVNSIDLRDGFVIDIGGGSTQVSQVRGRGFLRWFSQPIGALRAMERFVHSDPISPKDFRALEAGIADYFAALDWLSVDQGPMLVGVGGTIRTLAEIDQKVHNYPLDRVHGYVLTRERLETLIEQPARHEPAPA